MRPPPPPRGAGKTKRPRRSFPEERPGMRRRYGPAIHACSSRGGSGKTIEGWLDQLGGLIVDQAEHDVKQNRHNSVVLIQAIQDGCAASEIRFRRPCCNGLKNAGGAPRSDGPARILYSLRLMRLVTHCATLVAFLKAAFVAPRSLSLAAIKAAALSLARRLLTAPAQAPSGHRPSSISR